MARKKKITLNWLETIEEAQGLSKENNKPVLVFFTGSDWCPWCVGIYEYCMNTSQFAEFAAKDLNLVMIDFPKKIEVSEERKNYCKTTLDSFKITGLPTVVILDSNGVQLGTTGYEDGYDGVAFVNELKKIINGKAKSE
jgi:protein disulfide-isomerase